MVLEILLLAAGLAGFGLAGWKDLKTTEFPDWIPYSLIIFALAARGGWSLWTGNFSFLANSVLIGLIFLGFGLALYFTRNWGDGDAWLLGAMGFLFPEGIGQAGQLPGPLVLIFNFFLVAFLYIVAYSIAVGIRSGKMGSFLKGFRKDLKRVALITAGFTIVMVGALAFLNVPLERMGLVALFPVALFLMLAFLSYGRFIEGNLFKKRIHASELRAGDVPAGRKWRSMKKEEYEELRKKGGHLWIKEGVRLAPVFFLTIILMQAFGGIWPALIGLI